MSEAASALSEVEARDLLVSFRAHARTLLSRFRIPAQDAEDLLQDALLLYLRTDSEIPCAESWLQGTLKNLCLVYWRERRRRFYTVMDAAILEALAEPVEPSQEHHVFLAEVLGRIEELSRPCSGLLRLRYQADIKPAELADRLGYSRRGIYKIIDRCIAALSRRLLVARRKI